MKIVYRRADELNPYERNARKHSDEQVAQIASSIQQFGFNNPILLDGDNGVIAGHGRLEAAKKLGLVEVPTINLSHLSDKAKRAYIIADNQIALNATWNTEMLHVELDELIGDGFSLAELGFEDLPFDDDGADSEGGDDSEYTQDNTALQYEPSDKQPAVQELYDSEKTKFMISTINVSNIHHDVKAFLITAAYRHVKFNYSKIADFYASASNEIQELLEESALVIIDYENAINNGYTRLTRKINELSEAEAAHEEG